MEEKAWSHGKIVPVQIDKEMRSSYIDYAMSVIVMRALPDVRDGLKPVHRRILYAMHETGMTPSKPYKNRLVSSATYLVNTTHMVIVLCTMQRCVWPKISIQDIHW